MSDATPLAVERLDEVIDVMTDAFFDYPLMQWVVGGDGDVFDRVRRLVGFFVTRRVLKGGPMLGVFDNQRLVAAAALTLPVEPSPPPGITALELDVWRALGEDARKRYQAYADANAKFFIGLGPHHHLNMIGVRDSHKGRGLARPLLEAVHAMADADAASNGVSLTTERERNVTLYQHFEYSVIAQNDVDEAPFCTWGLFRPRRSSSLT
jgi:GNAT superfamily N-acetyltransferase